MKIPPIGQIKFRVTRLQSYFTIGATFINLLAAFKILGVGYVWLVVIGTPLLIALHLLDKNYVHPHESATMFSDNLEWQEMRRKVSTIYDKLCK